MDAVSANEHLSPVGGAHPDGVSRVVGQEDGGAVVLRVANADGRRVHTNEVLRLDAHELASFEPADDPDRNRSAVAGAAAMSDGTPARPPAQIPVVIVPAAPSF